MTEIRLIVPKCDLLHSISKERKREERRMISAAGVIASPPGMPIDIPRNFFAGPGDLEREAVVAERTGTDASKKRPRDPLSSVVTAARA